jgi:Flp pilus assembly protein protease CpaA
MLSLFVLILSLCISVRDIAEHRISNFSNFALFLLLLFDPHFASIKVALLGIFITVCLSIFSGFGGGDIKLISLLIMSQGSIVIALDYFQLFLISSTVSLAIAVVARRSFAGAIPMAPAILTPFMIRYLAI